MEHLDNVRTEDRTLVAIGMSLARAISFIAEKLLIFGYFYSNFSLLTLTINISLRRTVLIPHTKTDTISTSCKIAEILTDFQYLIYLIFQPKKTT